MFSTAAWSCYPIGCKDKEFILSEKILFVKFHIKYNLHSENNIICIYLISKRNQNRMHINYLFTNIYHLNNYFCNQKKNIWIDEFLIYENNTFSLCCIKLLFILRQNFIRHIKPASPDIRKGGNDISENRRQMPTTSSRLFKSGLSALQKCLFRLAK